MKVNCRKNGVKCSENQIQCLTSQRLPPKMIVKLHVRVARRATVEAGHKTLARMRSHMIGHFHPQIERPFA